MGEQFAFSKRIVDRINDANDAIIKIRDLKKQIDGSIQASKNDSQIAADGKALQGKLGGVEETIYQVHSTSDEDALNYPIMLNDQLAGVLGAVMYGAHRPTEQSYQVFRLLSAQLQTQLTALNDLLARDLVAYNQELKAKGIAEIHPSTQAATAQPSPPSKGETETAEEDDR